MATTANPPPGALPVENGRHTPDPFISTPSDAQRHRYSGLDSHYNSVYSNGSPAQAKRALEAHLAETERRLGEASRLGQILVKQRTELSARLRDLDDQQQDDEVAPELKSKLLELEKDFNDVTRETARAFLSKSRVPSGETSDPSVLSSDAQPSPSKIHPPSSRKQRNQALGRSNDIKLATEISTSLLNQVRELQAACAEKDEALKEVNAEKSQLETDFEGLRQRLRAMDESEQRYKDENWGLETQIHELTTSQKESSDREHKLQQNLNASKAQHAAILREFEELKLAFAKLGEDQTTARKHHESELLVWKRNVSTTEHERDVLQRKIDELTNQNKELAKAVTYRMASAEHAPREQSPDTGDQEDGHVTPDHSPPGSPSKATPRHGALESETLKSSLHHAHRMIQNLKNNIHREKTEKIELKRMLQDARDELETRRSQPGVDSGKKRKVTEKDVFKKPARPAVLGAARRSTEDVIMDDPDWEDQDGSPTPSKRSSFVRQPVDTSGPQTDDYVTATENSDAFETANERESATETESFETGAETLDGDSSDDLTETESGVRRNEAAKRPPMAVRQSFESTASTDEDEPSDIKTPVQTQPRYKLRVNRGANRRSSARSAAEAWASPALRDSPAVDSPASVTSNASSAAPAGQSLFAELGNLSDVETEEGTPRSAGLLSPKSSPEMLRKSPAPSRLRMLQSAEKPEMVDSGMMTEPWSPDFKDSSAAPAIIGAAVVGGIGHGLTHGAKAVAATGGDGADEPAPERAVDNAIDATPIPEKAQPAPALEDLTPHAPVQQLSFSSILSQSTEPVEPASPTPVEAAPSTPVKSVIAPLGYSHVTTQATSPRSPPVPLKAAEALPVKKETWEFTPISHQETEPVEPRPATSQRINQAEPGTPRSTEEAVRPTSSKSNRRFLGTVFRRSKIDKSAEGPIVAEDSTSQPSATPSKDKENATEASALASKEARVPFQPVEANALPPPVPGIRKERSVSPKKASLMLTEGTQTLLSADDLDKLMKAKYATHATHEFAKPTSPTKAAFGPTSPRDSFRNRRPGSAGSIRSNRASTPPPPLPTEAKQAIAAATQRAPGTTTAHVAPGTMGPPAIPASAYRNRDSYRPRTPLGTATISSPTKSQATIRASQQYGTRSGAASPATTRRSSVSSFASELDYRFNISRAADSHGFDSHTTDPRMIQAITQTMIGEFLWKYTRKRGREEMSSSRHRRFFWVHPYTRTLYWSEQDPSTAGRAQLKAKSVAIEAVRVVTDDNPMPPGLHRKSLVVITPGRSIMFTATTSQRHETWFNALSYLLLRTSQERDAEDLTAEDVDEFNPGNRHRSSSRATGRSRTSQSSYGSRTTTVRTASPARYQHPTLAQRQSAAAHRASSTTAPSPAPSQSGRWSSLSGKVSSIRGSFSSRYSRSNIPGEASSYDPTTHEAHDSAEDLRQVIESQEREADRVENVRACCDGKHDVGSLSGTRRGSRTNRHSQGRHASATGTVNGTGTSRSHSRSMSGTVVRKQKPANSSHAAAMDPANIAVE